MCVVFCSEEFDSDSFVLQTEDLIVKSETLDGSEGDLKGSWDQEPGQVTLNIDAEVPALEEIFSSFQLTNPIARQEARTVKLSVVQESARGLVTIVPPFDMAGSVLSATPSGTVRSLQVTESTKVQSSSNIISVSFSLSYPLSHGAKVTLFGLLGTDTPNNPKLKVEGDDGDAVFGGEAAWTQNTGTLILSVKRVVLRSVDAKV